MEMCYDGALVMPSNYAVLDEDEMMYTEGGLDLSAKWVGVGLDIGISAICAAISGGFTAYFKGLVKQYGKQKAGLHFGNQASAWAIKYFGARVGQAVSAAMGVALTVITTAAAPGAAIANYWATHDNNPYTKDTIEI